MGVKSFITNTLPLPTMRYMAECRRHKRGQQSYRPSLNLVSANY